MTTIQMPNISEILNALDRGVDVSRELAPLKEHLASMERHAALSWIRSFLPKIESWNPMSDHEKAEHRRRAAAAQALYDSIHTFNGKGAVFGRGNWAYLQRADA